VEQVVVSGLKPGGAALVAGLVLGGGALLGRKAPAPATAA
jgi:hypothetical protein